MSRYSSHIWKPFSDNAGSYTGGPKKLVLHSTEGSTAAGAFSAYADGGVPHFTWVIQQAKYQHTDTSIAATALRNDPGGVQTNKDGAIQVEIVGFAAGMRNLSDAALKWLGEAMLEVCAVEGINPDLSPTFYDQLSGFTLATKNALQRFTYGYWENFNGICGHQHVPENHHWDPGALNVIRAINLARGSVPTPIPLPEPEDDMAYQVITCVERGPEYFVCTPRGTIPIRNMGYYNAGVATKQLERVQNLDMATFDRAKALCNDNATVAPS